MRRRKTFGGSSERNSRWFAVGMGILLGGSVACGATVLDRDTFAAVQDDEHVVTVSYTLNGPAIVTASFCTNGVEVAGTGLRSVQGDIYRLLPAGTHTFRWWPRSDAPAGVSVTNGTVKLTAWPTNAPPLFMAVNLAVNADGLRFYPSEAALPYPVTDDQYKTDWLLMKRVSAGGREWRMGSPANESDRVAALKNGVVDISAEEAHLVTLSDDYYMGVYEVTQKQMLLVSGKTWGGFKDLCCAAHSMSPNNLRGDMSAGGANDWPLKGHAVAEGSLIALFRAKAGDHVLFDLPTEAQWEYAARAGSPYRFAIVEENQAASTNVAWNSAWPGSEGGSAGYVHRVGRLLPNAWGFYDMLGNVGEWCLDWKEGLVSTDAVTDPEGPDTGTIRVARGGGYYWGPAVTRCAGRACGWTPDQARDNHGFRLWASCVIK